MSRVLRLLALAFAVLGLVGSGAYAYAVAPEPAVSMAAAAVSFGFVGSLVAARRMYFLAGAAPHSALLAALLAVPLAFMGFDARLATALIGVLLVYAIGFFIHRGVDPDTATSLFVSVTASLSVVLAYVVLARYPLGFDVAALVFGDPLLATRSDAATAALVAVLVAALGLLTYREQVYMGVSREHALLAGINTAAYDLVFYTLLGAALSLLIRVAGFVLEHVMVLIPGVIAARAPSAADALLYALASSLSAAALGLWSGLALNVSPAGTAGLVLFVLYAAALVLTRRGRRVAAA